MRKTKLYGSVVGMVALLFGWVIVEYDIPTKLQKKLIKQNIKIEKTIYYAEGITDRTDDTRAG